ncbi:MAG: XRE family transcriptional regulator [Coriobacteriales bacterium]|nr:XRE family transcriptional regulator [Coriobacteriales bacterium]
MNEQSTLEHRYGYHIKAFRKARGLTQAQFAGIAEVSSSAVSQWESNATEPTMKPLEKLARYFNVPKSIILGDIKLSMGDGSGDGSGYGDGSGWGSRGLGAVRAVPPNTKDSDFVYVPAYSSVTLEEAKEMAGEIIDEHPVPKEIQEKHPHAYLLRVKDSSMDKVLPQCSYAYIDIDDTDVQDGEIYLVTANGVEAIIRQIEVLHNGWRLVPHSTDPTYKPVIYDFDESRAEQVRSLGRVVWCTMPFDYLVKAT